MAQEGDGVIDVLQYAFMSAVCLLVFAWMFWVMAHFIEPEWARSFWSFPFRMYRDLLRDLFGGGSA